MDPNLLSILLGLITNALTSLIASSGRKTGNLLIGKDFLEKWELDKSALSPLLHQAISNAAETFPQIGPVKEEIMASFLFLPETEEIVRQIYSIQLDEDKEQSYLKSLQQVFLTSFTLFANSFSGKVVFAENDLRETSDFLFDLLVKECNIVLDSATDRGILAAHEAKSNLRYQIIASELEAIHKRLDFFVGAKNLDLQMILDFEKRYRSQVRNSHSSITPPNFDTARKLPIDSLFVPPRFYTVPREQDEEPQTLYMKNFFACTYRTVILGNPGGGKSTFSLKLCHELAKEHSHILFAGRDNLTPILVILREYGADKKDRNCSILEFIETEAKATYQLSSPPLHAFEYLLLNGKAMVIFDGLDELLDTSYRQEIRNDVEAFCHLYPSVPVLVTSREVGYEQAPLDENMFETFRLAEFDDLQVREYVEKWFNHEDRDSQLKLRKEKIQAFLNESMIVPDLRSNPLMLALLCNIYRGETYIPRNRPEVYEKCATMLFERWDKSRKLYVPPVLEEHMRPLMEYLAQWIFSDEVLRKGVTEQELIAKATEYLNEWVFESILKAEKVALDFIQFCTGGRAWVFLDTGTRKEGEKLYQFAHTTFLEYFTASYFVRNYRTPEALIGVLSDKIAKREWDVMAQLAFQLQSKRILGAADELLIGLVTILNQESKNTRKYLLSFAIRCLNFITPRPKVVRILAETWIDGVIPLLNATSINRISSSTTRHSFDELLDASIYNYEVIVDVLENWLIEEFHRISETKKIINILNILFYFISHAPKEHDKLLAFNASRGRIINKCTSKLVVLSHGHLEFCLCAFRLDLVSISDLVKWHGLQSLFQEHIDYVFGITYSPIYFNIINNSMSLLYFNHDNNFAKYSGIINYLLSITPPWYYRNLLNDQLLHDIEMSTRNLPHMLSRFRDERSSSTSDPDTLFTCFIFLAPLVELNAPFFVGTTRWMIENTVYKYIRYMLLARIDNNLVDRVQVEMNHCKLSSMQQEFIWRWIKKEFNLVKTEDGNIYEQLVRSVT